MQLIPLLEVAISLVLLYLFFSQIASSIHEWISTGLGLRGKHLRKSLNLALNDRNSKNWAELLYLHPTVDTLARREGRPPAYISPELFADGIIDLVLEESRSHKFIQDPITREIRYEVQEPLVATELEKFELGLQKVEEGDFKNLLRTLLQNAKISSAAAPLPAFKKLLALWYEEYMKRVSGWYKQRTRWRLLLIGLLIAVACNLDSIVIGRHLWHNAKARVGIMAFANQVVDKGKPGYELPENQERIQQLDSLTGLFQNLGFPIGWNLPEVDSTKLPEEFYVPIAASIERVKVGKQNKEQTLLIPAHYHLYIMKSEDTLVGNEQRGKILAQRISWSVKEIMEQPDDSPIIGGERVNGALDANDFKDVWRGTGDMAQVIGQQSAGRWPGWIITALALAFGATFWFELLSKLVNVRNLGPKPKVEPTNNTNSHP